MSRTERNVCVYLGALVMTIIITRFNDFYCFVWNEPHAVDARGRLKIQIDIMT